MPTEVKIIICRPPFPPLTEKEVTKEQAFQFVKNVVERLKQEPGWTVSGSSAPPPSEGAERWHEFKLVKGPLHEMHGLDKDGV